VTVKVILLVPLTEPAGLRVLEKTASTEEETRIRPGGSADFYLYPGKRLEIGEDEKHG
jgi:hypothetical protein